jgi:hypothetical protein
LSRDRDAVVRLSDKFLKSSPSKVSRRIGVTDRHSLIVFASEKRTRFMQVPDPGVPLFQWHDLFALAKSFEPEPWVRHLSQPDDFRVIYTGLPRVLQLFQGSEDYPRSLVESSKYDEYDDQSEC